MSEIDRQRVAAVRHLEAAGYRFERGAWHGPDAAGDTAPVGVLEEADAMHGLLVLRADVLEGCTEGSEEAAELERIVDTIERYEAKRWPDGKVEGGKG
jgi:hypothetical protein